MRPAPETSRPGRDTGSRGRRGPWRDLGLGLCVSAALLIVSELVLALAGLGRDADRQHLTRGFDPRASYIVADPERPGGFRTRYRGEGQEQAIPPKSAAVRVLMFGGSNVQGFPAGRLERRLEERTGLDFEVINLGRNGYGSERVSIVLRQALERLAPDVVFLFTGHNEFTERGFAVELEDQWSSPILQRVAGVLLELRTMEMLTGLFAPGAEGSGAEGSGEREPEPRGRPDLAFAQLDYQDTLGYFDAFERNLRDMLARATERGARVVLGTPIYNRFSVPFVATLPRGLDPQSRRAVTDLLEQVARELPEAYAPLLPATSLDRVHASEWNRQSATGHFDSLQLPGWRQHSGAFARFDPELPPREVWHPKILPVYEALQAVYDGPADDAARASLERVEERLLGVLALVPDHPLALFQLGLVQLALGRDEAVVRSRLEDAASYDRAPRKASRVVNARVSAVAAEFPDVLFLDTDRIFRERAPMELTGWEVMFDHCHLNRGAIKVLMNDFALAIAERWY